MSHQTGIRANDELKKQFGQCHTTNVRALCLIIDNEELALKSKLNIIGNWEDDFDKVVPCLIEENDPCFILYKLDTKNSLGHEWIFITWSPDSAPVRQKMLYASTKATLKNEFGSAHLKSELFCNVKDDATLKGFRRHLRGESAPAPLTDKEEALKALSIEDKQTNYSPDSRQQTLSGVSFPITQSSYQALSDMAKGVYNYLQFRIDVDKEEIHLSKSANVSLNDLPAQVPSDVPRYHLFLFKHTHEGDHLETIVFIYSMPGYSCSIKERMLYSSCKGPFSDIISQNGLEIIKKIEIDDGKELTEEFLQDEVHPKRNLHRPAFAKPKGPPNRGAKRITKTQTTQ
ncbi:twinfilin actin binding protein isoform X1 [Arctopsyche grandis]|uniref:twinfilin actin binding protein isoform X1 n=1 Tax=Arctopsyche grandis TaxID=121162 RepID=UPI00406DA388